MKIDKKVKAARRAQVYPISAERELQRVNLTYFNAVMKAAKPHIANMMKLYEAQTRADSRFDDVESFRSRLFEELLKFADDADDAVSAFSATKMISRTAEIAKSRSLTDWFKLVKDTVGIAPVEAYYDDILNDAVEMWVQNNVSYVSSISREMQNTLADIILWGYNTHQPMVNVYNRIEKQLGVSKSQARFYARDQMGTLTYQLTRREHESMGVTHYYWNTKRDGHVRACHRSLHGQMIAWNDPPEMWYETQRGIVSTGRRCHPGEDYGCRCTAKPIFDMEKAVAKIQKQVELSRKG